METNKILLGDCALLLKNIPSESIDQIATDPPYGLEFMGKDWDKAVPHVDIWRECLRVLKSGAFAFILCTPRQDCLNHMIMNLEAAGFDCGFTSIYWTYASGFPKAINISKGVDRKRKGEIDKLEEWTTYLKRQREKLGLSKKQVDDAVCNGSSMYMFYEGRINDDGYFSAYLPNEERYVRLKEMLQLDNRFDELIEREEREVLGTAHHRGKAGPSIGIGGQTWNIVPFPVSKQAQVLNGSYGGFQPKPAVEVILVAMKSLSERTYVDQALKNQKGVTWLDDARIPFQSEDETTFRPQTSMPQPMDWHNKGAKFSGGNDRGRFPANLLCGSSVDVDLEGLLELQRAVKSQ